MGYREDWAKHSFHMTSQCYQSCPRLTQRNFELNHAPKDKFKATCAVLAPDREFDDKAADNWLKFSKIIRSSHLIREIMHVAIYFACLE